MSGAVPRDYADGQDCAEWTPRGLLAFAFPHDIVGVAEAIFPSLLEEVEKCFGVHFYAHEGRRYYSISNRARKHFSSSRKGQA